MDSMDSTYEMNDDTMYQQDDTMIDDMEDKLERLEEFDNETQLELLYHEINHILIHGVQPNDNWYEDRVNYIQAYHTIDWKDLAVRSYQRDNTVYDAAVLIIDHLEQLEEEWSASPEFNLCVYQRLLDNIRSIWKYYSREYHVLDHSKTVDILDLMNSMDNM